MLVNPSIYNVLGRFTSNYDLMTLERRNGSSANTSKLTGFPYKNSLSDQFNQQAYQKLNAFDTNFKPDIKSMFNTLKLLSNNKSAVYDDRKAVEQSKAFDVSTTDGATLGKQTLKVSQIATAQKNVSVAKVQTDVMTSDTTGNLSIKQNGKTQTINFTLKQGETNEAGYIRLAKTINQSKMGVTAEVKTDETGYSKLTLTSNQTGKASAFEVSGTLADELKLADTQEDAKNMTYELNGKAGESETNQLSLEKGKINVKVTATNTEAETFDIQASSATLVSTLKDFATSFNKFVDDNKDSNNPMTKSIVKQFTNTVTKALDKLEIDGFSTNSDGKIVVDDQKLSKGLEGRVDSLKNELSKFDSFASNLVRKTDQILKMPLSDLSPDLSTSKMPIKAFMYNYTAQSALNNIAQMTNPGNIMDILI